MICDASTAQEAHWMGIANEETQKARQLRHLHGRGLGTVFVLDTSASMDGDGFRQMKEVFTSIVDEISRNTGPISDNVSVVIFGRTVKFIQYPTNNYQSLRHCLDAVHCAGRSPLTAGLIVSTAVYNEPGAVVAGDWYLRTRIIVITDGKLTDSSDLDGPDDTSQIDGSEVKERFIRITSLIGKLNQITFVPVGDSDESLFEMLREISRTARVVHACDARQLGKYATNIRIAARFQKLDDLRTIDRQTFEKSVSDITNGSRTDAKDLDQISDFINNKEVYLSEQEVYDATEEEILEEIGSSLLPVGTRVRRGPHWHWKNQDSDGPGTVIGYDMNFANYGWVRVEWDNGVTLPYRYNLPGLSEPIFDIVECHEPRVQTDKDLIAVGCHVTRGPDWKWDNQDGGEDQIGAVYRVNPRGIVHVRWSNGIRSNYRYGFDGHFDVQLRDPYSDEMQHKLRKERSEFGSTDTFDNNQDKKGKDKLDQIKRPKTGGGKSVTMTNAEDPFLQTMEGRPQIEGLAFGIDTDITRVDNSTISSQASTSDAIYLTTTLSCEEAAQSSSLDKHSALYRTCNDESSERPKKVDTRKRRLLVELEEENMKLDNKRIKHEIERLVYEKEVLLLKKEVLQLKQSKLV